MNNDNNILLRSGYISAPVIVDNQSESSEAIATILMNLEYYGYGLSTEAFRVLANMSADALAIWWLNIEPELKLITGDDRNIGDFVVYKNFPKEVLSKSEAEYWTAQILMYWGLPNHLFTEPEEPRPDMNPKDRTSKTLMLASPSTLQNILNSLLSLKVRWKQDEFNDVIHLTKSQYVDFSLIEFKENLINLASYFIKEGLEIKVKTATDVLRLAAGLSNGDVSLREKTKFKSFTRKTRRLLMNMLEECEHIEEDVARRKGVWKRFLHALHPGDFKKSHPRVLKINDDLYNNRLITFNSRIEYGIKVKDPIALRLLASRPGEFMRRIVHLLDVFGEEAADSFIHIIPKLNLQQIVSIRRFLETSQMRKTRAFPPKGNWGKLQVGKARPVDSDLVAKIDAVLAQELKMRVPGVKVLDIETEHVKLPNGAEEGVYARGTVFKIPEHVNFIRTASYWKQNSAGNVWFDNGWNFFSEDWTSVGACCWDHYNSNDGAIFSGDPTNSKEMEGRGAQLIDLYLDKLGRQGVRYAVWNVLCFSNIPFSEAEDVFAALQWGSDPQKDKLFEPSRCQLSFELKSESKTKYICMIDIKKREMVYLDANLRANVQSAYKNGSILSEQMPAFLEYLESLPSVYDLFRESVETTGYGQVVYSDVDFEVDINQPAYIFKHETEQDYEPIDLNQVLSG